MEDVKLSVPQIQKLKHTQKKGFFATSREDSDMEEMLNAGLLRKSTASINPKEKVYHLTVKGRDYLKQISK